MRKEMPCRKYIRKILNPFIRLPFQNYTTLTIQNAIQEAFLAIARNPDNFFAIPQEKRVSYINVMIRNISFSIWNKKLKIEDTQVELDENILDESVSLDEKISSELSCIEIYRFIDTLSETTKTALYLKIHFHMKYSDIASQLEISEEANKGELHEQQ